MKKVLCLDRDYSYKFLKSNQFDVIVVAISRKSKALHLSKGLNVVACFDEEYESLPIADYDPNYLDHSFDCDRFLNRFDFNKRREILGKEISFWRRVLDKYKPSCILNESVTIEFMEVMYIESKRRNIPYLTVFHFPFAEKCMWKSGEPYNTSMGELFWTNVQETESDIDQARVYIDKMRNKQVIPFYIKNHKERDSISRLIRDCIHAIYFTIANIKVHLQHKFVYQEYAFRLQLQNDWGRIIGKYDTLAYSPDIEYFFYPLHFEPESCVEYSGYYFNDQVMLIGRIAHALNSNQRLIVKEHPQQRGALMTNRYKELKNKYANLLYLPGYISSQSIFPNIKALITLNGLAGFECWVQRIPVIVFGEVFYKDFPGIIKCDSPKNLQMILRGHSLDVSDEKDIVRYMAKICHNLTDAFPFFINGKWNIKSQNFIKQYIESIL